MPFDNPQPVPRESLDDLALLKIAREYIRLPSGWTQLKYIRDNKRCAVGAVLSASTPDRKPIKFSVEIFSQEYAICRKLCHEMPLRYRVFTFFIPAPLKLAFYNDEVKHAEVIKLFDCAIHRLETMDDKFEMRYHSVTVS